jgi:hypothetical protein
MIRLPPVFAAGVVAVAASTCRASAPLQLSMPAIAELESPAGPASAQPQLTSSPRGVILSWLENAGSQTRFMFSERSAGRWTQPQTVISSDDFFANWADLPSVKRLNDVRGTLLAHWLQRTSAHGSGYTLQLARSIDNGATWSPPFSPHRDTTDTEHGFAAPFELPGDPAPFGIVWLDGRAMTPAKQPGDDATGEMMLRSARYNARWEQQADEAIDLRVCDCCPTAAAVTTDGVVVAFRNRSADETRDIYVSRLAGGRWSDPAPVHNDGWRIDGCPVNGPALAAIGRHVAVAWFTAAGDQGRALVAFSHDAGRSFEPPIRVDDNGALGRVDVELFDDGSAAVSWIELANRRAAFQARLVLRNGVRSPAVAIANVTSNRGGVYPRMARGGGELVFAWPDAGDLRVRTALARLQ